MALDPPVADNAERLACFDKAVGTIVAASDSDDLRIVDREEVRETRRKLFGFALPDLGIFGRRDGEHLPAGGIRWHPKPVSRSGPLRQLVKRR